jgi:hypothetical protein
VTAASKRAERLTITVAPAIPLSFSFWFLVSGFFSAPNGNQYHLHTLTRTPIFVVFLLLSHKTKTKIKTQLQQTTGSQESVPQQKP